MREKIPANYFTWCSITSEAFVCLPFAAISKHFSDPRLYLRLFYPHQTIIISARNYLRSSSSDIRAFISAENVAAGERKSVDDKWNTQRFPLDRFPLSSQQLKLTSVEVSLMAFCVKRQDNFFVFTLAHENASAESRAGYFKSHLKSMIDWNEAKAYENGELLTSKEPFAVPCPLIREIFLLRFAKRIIISEAWKLIFNWIEENSSFLGFWLRVGCNKHHG